LAHQEIEASEVFREAKLYIEGGYKTDMLEEPLSSFVRILREHPNLPERLTTRDGKTMPGWRWLLQGIHVAKPQRITEEQKTQLLAAAYWSYEEPSEERRREMQEVVEYYKVGGHTIVAKRPYKRRVRE